MRVSNTKLIEKPNGCASPWDAKPKLRQVPCGNERVMNATLVGRQKANAMP